MALFEIEPGEIVGNRARLLVSTDRLAAVTAVDLRNGTFTLTFHMQNTEKPAISVDVAGDRIEGVLARLRTVWA